LTIGHLASLAACLPGARQRDSAHPKFKPASSPVHPGIAQICLVELAYCPEETERVAVELPLEPESAQRARTALARLQPYADVASFDDVRLLVSELISDALATEPRPAHGAISMEAQVLDGITWVMVGFSHVDLRLPPKQPRLGEPGWGVYLVQTLATRWGARYTTGSTYVWFEA
jgi:hypothetical protein